MKYQRGIYEEPNLQLEEHKLWTKAYYIYKKAYEKVHQEMMFKVYTWIGVRGKTERLKLSEPSTLSWYMLLRTQWMYVCFFIQLQVVELNLNVVHWEIKWS